MLDTLHVTELSNGIRVVSLAKPEAEGVRVAIHVRVGSRNEPERLNGASHFIEHMLFKGTPTRTAKGISQAIEGQGGVLNAYTDRDHTCYYAVVPYDKLGVALDVLGDLFYQSTFEPREFERERQVITEEIRMYDDQPDSLVMDRLAAQLWAGHPLGRPILGPMMGVLTMPRAEVLAYRKAQYAPCRTLFSFAGRVDHEACVKAVSALAGRLRNPRILREPEPFSRVIPQERLSVIRRSVQQTQLAFGWRVPGAAEAAPQPALSMLSCLLGETMMSRLFQSIRERRGLCYSVSSGVSQGVDFGALSISAGCAPAKAERCARAILAEVRRLAECPVGAAELRRTRDYLCGRFRLRMDGTPIGWAATRLLFGLPADPEAMLAGWQAVRAEDIQGLAQQLLTPAALSLAVVEPEQLDAKVPDWAAMVQA